MASQTYSSTARAVKPPLSTPRPETTRNFADPDFDPADFLNESLSPLTVAASQPNASRAPGSVPLTELSAQVQSLLSTISAQNVRLSTTLSQLTDEILRSGGRLAYEVEVLRGETIGLSETLTDVLREDIAKFVPEPSAAPVAVSTGRETEQTHDLKDTATSIPIEEGEDTDTDTEVEENPEKQEVKKTEQKENAVAPDPEYITNLRTLNQVRSRLEDVVQTFGTAMEWPLPPSEVSFSSSFISVSGPDRDTTGHNHEEKGQEIMKKLRTEVSELLESEGGGWAGLEAASGRVETLRILSTVWKGSAEEKARGRFVDSLAKMLDDRRRTLEQTADPQRGPRPRSEQRRDSDSGGGGLFRNLQRLREEMYLE
ncbi:hypothetical protein NUU61_003337 [Penicillium alfredii]|uniref:Uncharacterized protein n=1 Tax=Penicillium alfredii TaxID=1506179 RepID=A0A9W9KGU5_9EURO|nr:uncharacterized protein NUU61_003337 [Penicillium alfredii]KAJ5105990.1 hypothetical protein NUU61_003337 [Penicillium alfredii]